MAKSDLLILTKMKLTTLNRFSEPLEREHLIISVGLGESALGRKPFLFDINSKQFVVIGIDLSRTYVQVVITDLKLSILANERFFMSTASIPFRAVETIKETVNRLIADLGVERTKVLGVGLGTVGPLDLDKGIMTHPHNFPTPEWSNLSIKSILEQELKLPVDLDNGANTALLAESLFGDGKCHQNIVYINCGIGIRTGASSAGTIVRTVNDAEDAFGHMIVDFDGEPCSCGNYGCVECYSTILSIIENFVSEYKKGRKTLLAKSVAEIQFVDICNAAEANDELAKEVIVDAATVLGIGLANYINLLNPNLIILSGPLINNRNYFIKSVSTLP